MSNTITENYVEEMDDICQLFSDYWRDSNGNFRTPIAFENADFKAGNSEYVRFFVVNGDVQQMSIGAPNGGNCFRHVGRIAIKIFVPVEAGKIEALSLSDEAMAIFRNIKLKSIKFGSPYVKIIGTNGDNIGFFQVNVFVPFTRDSFF